MLEMMKTRHKGELACCWDRIQFVLYIPYYMSKYCSNQIILYKAELWGRSNMWTYADLNATLQKQPNYQIGLLMWQESSLCCIFFVVLINTTSRRQSFLIAAVRNYFCCWKWLSVKKSLLALIIMHRMKRLFHCFGEFKLCIMFFFFGLFVFVVFFFYHSFISHRLEIITSLYELFTMVNTNGTRTCVHPHSSRPLYHCDMWCGNDIVRYWW